jgi:hypothetical protein
MDEAVREAMQRWPNVPNAFGWLRLDRRGAWYLIQRNAPNFDESRDAEGSLIRNDRMNDFIARNYESDELGRWFFQNGPQRVFVDLELAPIVYRIDTSQAQPRWLAHTGDFAEKLLRAAVDTQGNVFVETELGPGVIDDRHLARLEPYLFEPSPSEPSPFDIKTQESHQPRFAIHCASNSAQAVHLLPTDDAGTLFGFEPKPRD